MAFFSNVAIDRVSLRENFRPAGPGSSGVSRVGNAGARWRKFLSYYRPHTRLLAADLGCAFVVSATALFLPLCANYIVKRLSLVNADPALLQRIYLTGAVMFALLGVQVVCNMFVDYQGHMMGAKMEGSLRQELFEHLQKLSFTFYDRTRVGQLMSRITNDLLNIAELYHHGPEDLAIAALKFSGVVIILFSLNVPLTLLILGTMPIATAYTLYFSRRMNKALAESRVRIAAINEYVEDSLSGIRVVQSFANEHLESQRFASENERFLATRALGYSSEAIFSIGLGTFAQILTIAVIVVGAHQIIARSLDAADLLTYLLCVTILVDPIQRVVNFVRLWQQGGTGFRRFMEVLEVEPDIQERPAAAILQGVRGAISLRAVNFRYGEESNFVLKNVSLEIASGEFVALTGYSGVGKTTLCSLIPRFYDANDGAVLIDGHDVRDVALKSLRQNIGIVQQDVYLFAGTVLENIAYGKPGASRADIVEAAMRANAHDFITALPNGYDTDIGPRGVKLSGGQKQRLTIARVFLKNPPILIFDEATSALDYESERAVQAALQTLVKGRTTIVIAHRLSTVRHADRIVVLTDDGIAEQGTHDELIAAGGPYAALYSAQASI